MSAVAAIANASRTNDRNSHTCMAIWWAATARVPILEAATVVAVMASRRAELRMIIGQPARTISPIGSDPIRWGRRSVPSR